MRRLTISIVTLGFGVTASLGSVLAQPAPQKTSPQAPAEIPSLANDSIPEPFGGVPGDPVRGRAIVADRKVGLCLLCHSGPIPEERLQGNLAPSLAGAGSRWSEGQLRLRIADASRLNPATIMPPYYRSHGLTRVAPPFKDKTILSAEEVEDVIAYLVTLKE